MKEQLASNKKMKKKIIVTTGTRAEYGILRSILFELKKNNKFDLYLIVTGSLLDFVLQEN